MHDRFKKRYQSPKGASSRVRQQIAAEAARRLYDLVGPEPGADLIRLREATEGEYYSAKRKAAAVLGQRVRPGDLPTDAEVREQVLAMAHARSGKEPEPEPDQPEPEDDAEVARMADHVDRFAIYRLRLEPLEAVKQNPRTHPEGDALFHSLQVFERARDARPYDEEFLVAALLHDVGKAIDPANRIASGVEALRGAVTDRTLWLVANWKAKDPDRPGKPGPTPPPEHPEWRDDLDLLLAADLAGRVPGAPVPTVDEALDYLRGLEAEDYLD